MSASVRSLLIASTTAILAGSAASPAQEPAPPIDLARLAAMVDAAHRPDGATRAITAYRSALTIEQVAADAAERGQAELRVQFLMWRATDQERPRPLIRYELTDSARPVVRGRDRLGYWMLSGGKAEDLRGRDFQQEYDAARRDLRLAQQLLELLDPGAVLRALRSPSPVGQQELKLGRTAAVPCYAVSGGLEVFPMLQTAGDERPAHVKVYVQRDTGRLLAVEIWPQDDAGAPVREQGELVRLDGHRLVDGVLLPMQLTHFRVGSDGLRQVQMKVTLNTIHLNPRLDAEQLDRPR